VPDEEEVKEEVEELKIIKFGKEIRNKNLTAAERASVLLNK
jgi:hypothetical protein